MKFSTREDIDAPIEDVFEELCDFEAFERQAIRRGADVQCRTPAARNKLGAQWDAAFNLRGKQRQLVLTLDRLETPNGMGVVAASNGIDADFSVDLVALSVTRTRINVSLEMKPKNLSARLLIQSLKLAKGTLDKRFKLRMADAVRLLEQRMREKS